jgi:hypothetical protein
MLLLPDSYDIHFGHRLQNIIHRKGSGLLEQGAATGPRCNEACRRNG